MLSFPILWLNKFILFYCLVAILLGLGKILFFELEKMMTTSNDVSFYLGRRDHHRISLSNIFPSFNDVIKYKINVHITYCSTCVFVCFHRLKD